jgi:prepilin-type N-terminal cleavage/methylation domain-containing protein
MIRYPIHSRRRGFTMIELLVVIGLIAFLMALSIGVLRNAIGSARERATEATITKINGLVQQRVDAFNRAMERSDLEPGIQQMLAKMNPSNRNNKAMRRANEVMVKKDFFRYRFPQNFEEKNLLASPPSGVTLTVLAHKHQTQSAALLYWLLTQSEVYGIAPVDESAFGSAEVRDTDGDGLLEFIDGWGQPLRFYRWPTRLFRCGEDINGNGTLDSGEDVDGDGTLDGAGYGTVANPSPIIRRYVNQIWSGLPAAPTVAGALDPLARDPDDPLGQLLRAVKYGFFTASQIEVGIPVPAPTPAIPYHTIETYHAFLIVSAGPDSATRRPDPVTGVIDPLGLHEPSEGWPDGVATPSLPVVTTVGRLAGLTRLGSLDNHPINDNITNRKR